MDAEAPVIYVLKSRGRENSLARGPADCYNYTMYYVTQSDRLGALMAKCEMRNGKCPVSRNAKCEMSGFAKREMRNAKCDKPVVAKGLRNAKCDKPAVAKREVRNVRFETRNAKCEMSMHCVRLMFARLYVCRLCFVSTLCVVRVMAAADYVVCSLRVVVLIVAVVLSRSCVCEQQCVC